MHSSRRSRISVPLPPKRSQVPKLLTSLDALELYASGAHYALDWAPSGVMSSALVKQWTKFVLRGAMQEATVIVAPVHELDRLGADARRGKTVITSTVNDRRVATLAAFR